LDFFQIEINQIHSIFKAHGTFIGSIKLDGNKPQQVFIDSELKFGASTRTYVIRERPQANKHFPSMLVNANNTSVNDIAKEDTDDYHNSSLNATLPESEAELDVKACWIYFPVYRAL